MNAAIVGGGLGALALALRLRVAGWDVAVFESGSTFGGKMNRWQERGYTFDTGPSLITMPYVFEELFAHGGEHIGDHVQLVAVDPHAEYVYPDGTRIACPADFERWIETVREIEPRDATGVRRLHALGSRLFALSERTFFRRSPLAAPQISEIPALLDLPVRNGWGNYARTVARFVRSPYLRQIYNRYPTYVGSSPYRCPATLLVIPYLEHRFGGWYVKGGLYRIVERLAGVLRDKGVELRARARVTAIEREGRRVNGVRLETGESIRADAVVMNGDAGTVPALLGRKAEVRAETRSLSGFVMLAGVRDPMPGLGHHTVYFSKDYAAEFADLFERRQFPSDPTVYVNAPGDPATAPEGGRALFLMANAPGDGGQAWRAADVDAARRLVFERLRKSGCPEVAGRAEILDVWHPARFEARYLAPGGAIYGNNSHGWRNAFFRPPNRDRTYRGLYFVGGSSHPGGGTPMVLLSAKITAGLMNRDARV